MVTICLGRRLPGDSSDRYPRARRAALSPEGTPSYLVLLRAGFAWPAGHPAAGGLLPHHFTLTRQLVSGDTHCLAVLFLWHFPSGRPDWVLPSALLFGARTFLQPYSLTSAVTRPPRPGVSLPRRLGFLNPLVESNVHELVRAAILLASYVADGDSVAKLLQELGRLLVQLLQLGFFHPPFAVDLLHNELGVEVDLEPVRLPVSDRLQAFNQGLVFGLVVGRDAEKTVERAQPHAVVVLDDDSQRRRSRVAASTPVHAQPQRCQASTRIRPQFSQCTISSPCRSICMPLDVTVTRQAEH